MTSPNPIPSSSRPPGPVQMIFIAVMVVLVVMSVYDSSAYLHPSQPPISVGRITLTQNEIGQISLQVHVTNIGPEPVRLNGTIANPFLPNPMFQPYVLDSGSTSIGTASATWQTANFDGMSDYVQTANSGSLNPTNMSIELVFKYASLSPDQQMIISKGDVGTNSFYFYSYRSAGNVNDFVVYQNNVRYDQQLGDILRPGLWYDVVFTLDGHNVTAFVNGVMIRSWANPVSFLGNQNAVLIGKCGCGGYYFNGSVATVRLFDRPLSRSQVSAQYSSNAVTSEGLALWYQLNQTGSSILYDKSGNGNDGTIAGPVSFGPPLTIGQYYTITVNVAVENRKIYSFQVAVSVEGD